jgi:PIN domain nuclease of toxin-antitoxin system
LLDTYVLLWAAGQPEKLPAKARKLLLDADNELVFSSASFWEISVKLGLGRKGFRVEPGRLWRVLLSAGYRDLPVTSEHTIAVSTLPAIHKDPFDRVLIAQALVEGLTLLTADSVLRRYGEQVIVI